MLELQLTHALHVDDAALLVAALCEPVRVQLLDLGAVDWVRQLRVGCEAYSFRFRNLNDVNVVLVAPLQVGLVHRRSARLVVVTGRQEALPHLRVVLGGALFNYHYYCLIF